MRNRSLMISRVQTIDSFDDVCSMHSAQCAVSLLCTLHSIFHTPQSTWSVFELERARGPVAHNLAPGPIVFKFNGPGGPTEENHCRSKLSFFPLFLPICLFRDNGVVRRLFIA